MESLNELPPEPTAESLRAEYDAAQIAMRRLAEIIRGLDQERHTYAMQCHRIVNQAQERGIQL